MALASQFPSPPITHILQGGLRLRSVESSNRSRNLIGAEPRTECHVHYHLLQPGRNGRLGPSFRPVGENVPSIALAQTPLALESAVIEKRTYSGLVQLIEGGLGCWINMDYGPVPQSNFNGILVKLMVRVQLLGILAALGTGMRAGPAAAATSVSPYETGRSLRLSSTERSLVESPERHDFEEIDENSLSSGAIRDAGQSQQSGPRLSGVAMAAEDETEDDEAIRERAEFKAKPYAITVPLRIVGLRGSVPPVWLKDFMGSQGKRVKLMAEFRGSLRSIFSELSSARESKQLTPRSAMAADLVTIGDSWLSKAVEGGLISPIENAEQFEWYQSIGSKWQTFIRRDEHGLIDPNGKVWGVPYRWGSLVIAYNHAKLQKHGIPEIKDWADLWKPELMGKISMVASPREVVGAVLKALGASYNVNDFETDVPGGRRAMEEKFFALQNQVRLFDDDQYLKTLGAGEVWVAVGWSEDVVSFAKRTSNITVVAPQSGTSLWADLWCIPATMWSTKVGGRVRGPSPLILQWFDFCLQPARGNSFQHDVLMGASPLTLSERGVNRPAQRQDGYSDHNQVEEVSTNFKTNLVGGLLTPDLVAKSEFLEPLSKTALQDFRWLLSRKPGAPRGPVEPLKWLRESFQGVVESMGRRA